MLSAPFRSLGGEPAAAPAGQTAAHAPVEGAPFTYYLHTSPFRIYRQKSFKLRGWAWPQDGTAGTAAGGAGDPRPARPLVVTPGTPAAASRRFDGAP